MLFGDRRIELKFSGKKNKEKLEAFEKRAKSIIDKLVDIQMSIDHLELIYDSNNTKLKEKAPFFLRKFYELLWKDIIVGLSTIFEIRNKTDGLLNLQKFITFINKNKGIFPIEKHEMITYKEDPSENHTYIYNLDIQSKLDNLNVFIVSKKDIILQIVTIRDENIAHLKKIKSINITILEIKDFVKSFLAKLNDVHNEATAVVYSIKAIYQLDFKTIFTVFEELATISQPLSENINKF